MDPKTQVPNRCGVVANAGPDRPHVGLQSVPAPGFNRSEAFAFAAHLVRAAESLPEDGSPSFDEVRQALAASAEKPAEPAE